MLPGGTNDEAAVRPGEQGDRGLVDGWIVGRCDDLFAYTS